MGWSQQVVRLDGMLTYSRKPGCGLVVVSVPRGVLGENLTRRS